MTQQNLFKQLIRTVNRNIWMKAQLWRKKRICFPLEHTVV